MLTCCTCGCAPTVCWAKGFVAFLPVLHSPAGSGYAGSCGFSSPIWFTTFATGSPLRSRGWFVLDRNEGLVCFLFPFWAVSSCCRCPSGYSHHMDQVCGSIPTYERPTVVVGASPFYFWVGFDLCLRLLFAPCRYRRISWWPSLRQRVFGCPWLSPVFPVPCYGYMSASMTLAPGLRLSLVPYPRSFRMGLEPLSEAPLSALQLPAHSFLAVLAEAACLQEFLDLSFVLP